MEILRMGIMGKRAKFTFISEVVTDKTKGKKEVLENRCSSS